MCKMIVHAYRTLYQKKSQEMVDVVRIVLLRVALLLHIHADMVVMSCNVERLVRCLILRVCIGGACNQASQWKVHCPLVRGTSW